MQNLFSSLNFRKKYLATVSINYKAKEGPWGGANVFVLQLKKELENCGIKVRFDLQGDIDLILMIDPRENLQRTAYGLRDISAYRESHPGVSVIHRINECDKRKSTAFMDDILHQGNEVADYTIFISQWLCEYFQKRWFNKEKPHSVIYNGADQTIFHPVGSTRWSGDEKLRVVTHHWSDNPLKGFDVYKQLDELIANGKVQDCELWVIGRWPENLQWKSARTFPPTSGRELAELLRQCHLYLTASQWEPCGMHHVEGAQCGLPLLCHEDGGGIVEAGERYGIVFGDNLIEAIDTARSQYDLLRQKVLMDMPTGGLMISEYMKIIQYVLSY